MPKQLTKKDIDAGAQLIKKAEVKLEVEKIARSEVADVLKEITGAIKRLVDLHTLTRAMLERQAIVPASNDVLIDRIAEIQYLTQQTMENLASSISESRREIPTPRPEVIQDIQLRVTERDAWGRIISLAAHVEKK